MVGLVRVNAGYSRDQDYLYILKDIVTTTQASHSVVHSAAVYELPCIDPRTRSRKISIFQRLV